MSNLIIAMALQNNFTSNSAQKEQEPTGSSKDLASYLRNERSPLLNQIKHQSIEVKSKAPTNADPGANNANQASS